MGPNKYIIIRKPLTILVAFLLIQFTDSKAQNFDPVQEDPFSLTELYANSTPTLVDLDGDSDLDIMCGELYGGFWYYENIGTVYSPSFTEVQQNPFSLTELYANSAPAFADLDSDGDLDMMSGELYGGFWYYENNGTSSSPSFTEAQLNPFSLTELYANSTPTLVDLDGDGDLDMMSGELYGGFWYYENIGTSSSPSFTEAQLNPFSLTELYANSTPTLVDLDGDGDLDMMSGELYGGFWYYENIGTESFPSFDAEKQNPFSLTELYANSAPVFADMNGDNDLDMMSGELYGGLYYYQNDGTVDVSNISKVQISVNVYPNPCSNKFTVKSNTNICNYELAMYDNLGNRINQFIIIHPYPTIDVSSYPDGMYLLKIFNSEVVYSRIIIKQAN